MKIVIIITAFATALASASFKDVCLSSHNELRKLHVDTPTMTWDVQIAASAQAWADHLASSGSFYHDPNLGALGENLYSATGRNIASCAQAALLWYSEYDNYNYDNPIYGSTGVIGHFTQLVWSSSVKLGVGVATYLNNEGRKKTIIVARYSPPGNVASNEQYTNNVKPRKVGATVPSVYDLDPSLCKNAAGDPTCDAYSDYGFCDKTHPYYNMMETHCARKCGFC